MNLLQLDKLNQFYGASHTLWDIDLAVPEGECVVVMGRNGVGKTTLLRSIMGLLPTSGSIRFEDKDVARASAELRARGGFGYVPQGREVFARLTVEENLRAGLLARRDGRKQIPDLVFELFPVLKDMLQRRGGDLSGGQQQQLAIARALTARPRLLILDEPTEGIQPSVIKDIARVIRLLAREKNFAVVLVEQYYEFARDLADRIAVMVRGEVALGGPVE